MKTYLERQIDNRLNDLRNYEAAIFKKYGNMRRIYKLVGTDLEIKYGRAKILFDESLSKDTDKKKLQMIEMMFRAYDALVEKIKANGYKELEPYIRCYEFNKKTILVCDYNDEKKMMMEMHKNEKDVMFFSMEEMFKSIPSDFIEAKHFLTNKHGDVTFERITYEQRRQGQN